MSDHRSDMNDLYCWRCATPAVLKTVISLQGGYVCHLCSPCRNDWDVYIRKHPLTTEIDRMAIRLQQLNARTVYDGIDRTAELGELVAEGRRIQAELFEIGKEWVSAKPGREESNAAPDLLEACEKCERLLLDIGDPFRGDHWQMMQDIRAAIAKAKGDPQ
jgi:hypothetical protein